MLYSIVEAENHDIAVRALANRPHMTIPESLIEVMEVGAMGSHWRAGLGRSRDAVADIGAQFD